MSKVFIKRNKINEDITITDPTLAQQYLAVKKQMVDKKTKRDQLTRNVNQIDSELNILEKNLIAIETRSAQQNGKVKVQKPEVHQSPEEGTIETGEGTIETSESLDEKLSDVLVPKKGDELPSEEEYYEGVIKYIDEKYCDGETLAYEYKGLINKYYKKYESPEFVADVIIEIETNEDYQDVTSDLEWKAEAQAETEDLDDSYIGGDTMGKLAANRSMPVRVVQENLQYKKNMSIIVNGREPINIFKVDKYPDFVLIYYKDKLGDEQIYNSNWLDEQDVEIISKPKKYRSPRQLEKIQDDIEGQIQELEDELQYAVQEKKEIEVDMEEDLGDYDESTYIPQENPRYSLENKEKTSPEMPHDIWGTVLNDVDVKIKEIEDKLRKLYQDPDCPIWNPRYETKKEMTYHEAKAAATPKEFNNLDVRESVNESVNESIYEDIIDDLELEKEKLNKIQDFIIQTTQNIEINVDLPDEIESQEGSKILTPIEVEEPTPEAPTQELPVEEEPPTQELPVEEEPTTEEEPIAELPHVEEEPPAFDLIHRERELDIPEESPFEPTSDEILTNETLKTEDNKDSYTPELIEGEDIEADLELMNYEDEDEPQDEYVFHVKIDGETDHEIIAKIYKDNEGDFWTVRVVKGDEEPLQNMEFDPRLDKLELIGYLADIYDDIEILDKKEYEYLLDDKEKIDQEYYES
jgi:hypothetical protein